MFNFFKKAKKGFGLVEALIAISLLASFIIVLANINTLYVSLAFGDKQPLLASTLLEEGVEVVKFLRDSSWSTHISPLTIGTPYYLSFSSGWTLGAVPVQDGIFFRTIVLSDVYRDASDNIVDSGGTLDPNTKLVTVQVTWQGKSGSESRNIKTYLTNLFNN